jgi:hypothetical protein
MTSLTGTITQSLENHPVIQILLSFLPQEIVVLIAFKFKGFKPYPLERCQLELDRTEESWKQLKIQRTIMSIYTYRKNNDFSQEAFLFPRAEPPNVNKSFKICDIRNVTLKYQLYSRNIPVSPYNIQFMNMNQKLLMVLFSKLVDDNYAIMETINKLNLYQREEKSRLVRIYYRFDFYDFLQHDNFEEYMESISYPWF